MSLIGDGRAIGRCCPSHGQITDLSHLGLAVVFELRGLHGIAPAPKLDGVENECVEECGEHIDRDYNHSEKDELLHPFLTHFPAAFDAAVPMVDVSREVEW